MTAPDASAPDSTLQRAGNRSFTRRGGRMPQRHHRAMAEHSDQYVFDLAREGEGSSVVPGQRAPLAEAFGPTAPVVVEIGSGAGDCIVAAAQQAPGTGFVAMEVWRPGVAQTLAKAVHHGVDNVRVAPFDAGQALGEIFEPGSLAEVWVFFPDPWPKKKHHKRRLVTPEFADTVARVLRPGGVWRMATDWADYAWQMRDVVEDAPEFDNPHRGRLAHPDDGQMDPRGDRGGFAPRFSGRVMTRFETKGLRAGRLVRDLEVIRRG